MVYTQNARLAALLHSFTKICNGEDTNQQHFSYSKQDACRS